MWGFVPADEVPSTDSGQALLFRQKGPKPFLPVRGPSENGEKVRQQGRRPREGRGVQARTLRPSSNENAAGGLSHHSLPGASASVPNLMAQELAPLKQPSPKSRFGTTAPPRPTQLIENSRKTNI